MRVDSSGGGVEIRAIWEHSLVFSNRGSNIGGLRHMTGRESGYGGQLGSGRRGLGH